MGSVVAESFVLEDELPSRTAADSEPEELRAEPAAERPHGGTTCPLLLVLEVGDSNDCFSSKTPLERLGPAPPL